MMFLIWDSLCTKMAHSEKMERLYQIIKLSILGLLLFSFLYLQFTFLHWYHIIFSILKNIFLIGFYGFWNDLRKYGMCETILMTIIIPSFIIEGNAIMTGELDFYKIVELGPVNFMYIIVYISYGELLEDAQIKNQKRATGTETRLELNQIFGKQDSFRLLVICLCYVHFHLIYKAVDLHNIWPVACFILCTPFLYRGFFYFYQDQYKSAHFNFRMAYVVFALVFYGMLVQNHPEI